jgi:hypothetical protein
MNCVEFERILPDYLEGARTFELQAHLQSCPVCSALSADLSAIVSQAPLLQESEEPSPRVWNALEAQLRREGLIHSARANDFSYRDVFHRMRSAWLVPAAAALLIVAGAKLYYPAHVGDSNLAAKHTSPQPKAVASEDKDLLNTVTSRVPAQVASYRHSLDEANKFIRDAEQSVKNDPNDVYAQELLINAYEQKEMLYDLTVDRNIGEQ